MLNAVVLSWLIIAALALFIYFTGVYGVLVLLVALVVLAGVVGRA